MRSTVLALGLWALLTAGCASFVHQPDLSNPPPPATPLAQAVTLAVVSNGGGMPDLHGAVVLALRRREDVLRADLRSPGDDVSAYDHVARISLRPYGDGEGYNFVTAFPGFLAFAPTWARFRWDYQLRSTTLLSDPASGEPLREATRLDRYHLAYTPGRHHFLSYVGWTAPFTLGVSLAAPFAVGVRAVGELPQPESLDGRLVHSREGPRQAQRIANALMTEVASLRDDPTPYVVHPPDAAPPETSGRWGLRLSGHVRYLYHMLGPVRLRDSYGQPTRAVGIEEGGVFADGHGLTARARIGLQREEGVGAFLEVGYQRLEFRTTDRATSAFDHGYLTVPAGSQYTYRNQLTWVDVDVLAGPLSLGPVGLYGSVGLRHLEWTARLSPGDERTSMATRMLFLPSIPTLGFAAEVKPLDPLAISLRGKGGGFEVSDRQRAYGFGTTLYVKHRTFTSWEAELTVTFAPIEHVRLVAGYRVEDVYLARETRYPDEPENDHRARLDGLFHGPVVGAEVSF